MEKMDLASLTSISDCVERLKKKVAKIDILINNAGVMACPESRTSEGFEMQVIEKDNHCLFRAKQN